MGPQGSAIVSFSSPSPGDDRDVAVHLCEVDSASMCFSAVYVTFHVTKEEVQFIYGYMPIFVLLSVFHGDMAIHQVASSSPCPPRKPSRQSAPPLKDWRPGAPSSISLSDRSALADSWPASDRGLGQKGNYCSREQ